MKAKLAALDSTERHPRRWFSSLTATPETASRNQNITKANEAHSPHWARAPGAVNEAFFFVREGCPVCGARDVAQIYRRSLTESPVKDYIASHYAAQGTVDWSLFRGTDYILCECRTCGLVYQQNVPKDHVLDRIYNEMVEPAWLQRLEASRLTIDNFNRIAGEMDVLFRMCGKHPSDIRFLDYGFGYGRWARVAAAMGATVFATEIGEDKKANAGAIGATIIDDRDIERMGFDVVHAEQVFEHLVDPAGAFRRLASATDGVMKIAVPPFGNARRMIAARGILAQSPIDRMANDRRLNKRELICMAVQPLEHVNMFSRKTIERLAQDNDMRVVSRVRRASVAFNLTSFKLFRKSVANVALMAAKMALAPESGYYILAPKSMGDAQ